MNLRRGRFSAAVVVVVLDCFWLEVEVEVETPVTVGMAVRARRLSIGGVSISYLHGDFLGRGILVFGMRLWMRTS